jgi:hypothetical protein
MSMAISSVDTQANIEVAAILPLFLRCVRIKQNGRHARCRVAGRDIDSEWHALRAPPAARLDYFR